MALVCALALLVPGLPNSLCHAATAAGAAGITASVAEDGSYSIKVDDPAWRFAGSVGQPVTNLGAGNGSDRAGSYAEIAFDYASPGARHASIRVYTARRAVLFTVQYLDASGNTAPFPSFSVHPSNLMHLTYTGAYAITSFPGFAKDSPWIFFDKQASNSFILSAAANFMVANTAWGPSGEINSGVSPAIGSLPAGFTHQTLLVVEHGVNAAFETWGDTLTDLYGKVRPPNDADASLRSLGYWTDNGAAYYYRTEPSHTYEETLTGIRDQFADAGLPLAYIQLDSWFYPKGANADWTAIDGGIHDYIGASTLFTPDLAGFQERLGLPLITHSRWIDPSSPYRTRYRMSGNVAVDPAFWEEIGDFLQNSGVQTYEQDWLGDKAYTDFNLTDPEAFMSNMAGSMARRGITLQYCMAAPRHFLQSVKYGNVTTIRSGEDRWNPDRWTKFLFSSRLASALGLWPYSDAFCSTEPDNMLLATLSAGPLGLSDRSGTVNFDNLRRAVRGDGVIVKPDVPIVPFDEMYPGDSLDSSQPMVAYAYSEAAAGGRTYYVMAYARGSENVATIRLSRLGLLSQVYVYDYFDGTGRIAGPADTFSQPMRDGKLYLIVAPVNETGVALLGDLGHFVPLGKARVTDVDDTGPVYATVQFAAGETSRVISGFSRLRPRVTALSGTARGFTYDTASQLFQFTAGPDAEGQARIQIEGNWRYIAPPGKIDQ